MKQRSANRDQRSGGGGQGSDAVAALLRAALPPVGDDRALDRDLWPAMLRRLRSESAPDRSIIRIPWFDWALVGGLVALLALFPAAIPVLLYYL